MTRTFGGASDSKPRPLSSFFAQLTLTRFCVRNTATKNVAMLHALRRSQIQRAYSAVLARSGSRRNRQFCETTGDPSAQHWLAFTKIIQPGLKPCLFRRFDIPFSTIREREIRRRENVPGLKNRTLLTGAPSSPIGNLHRRWRSDIRQRRARQT